MTEQTKWKVTISAKFGINGELFTISGYVYSDFSGIQSPLVEVCKIFNTRMSDLYYAKVEPCGYRTLTPDSDEAST